MKIYPGHLLATALIAGTFSLPLPAQALTWTVNGTVGTSATPITGTFTLDNENSASPNVTFSNLTIGALTFTAADAINVSTTIPSGSGVTAIDWLQGTNLLGLTFTSPLTPAGGTIDLDIVSDFNGDVISGTVIGNSPPVGIPEPSVLFGLAATAGSLFLCKRGRADDK